MMFPLARATAFLAFWVALAGLGIVEVLVGMAAAVMAVYFWRHHPKMKISP